MNSNDSLDLSGYPLLRVDQISRMDTDFLSKTLFDSNELLLTDMTTNLSNYLQKQINIIKNELNNRKFLLHPWKFTPLPLPSELASAQINDVNEYINNNQSTDELVTEYSLNVPEPVKSRNRHSLKSRAIDFGNEFIVAATDKKVRFYPKKMQSLETVEENKNKDRLERRKQAIARLLIRKQKREEILLSKRKNKQLKKIEKQKQVKNIQSRYQDDLSSSESESISGGEPETDFSYDGLAHDHKFNNNFHDSSIEKLSNTQNDVDEENFLKLNYINSYDICENCCNDNKIISNESVMSNCNNINQVCHNGDYEGEKKLSISIGTSLGESVNDKKLITDNFVVLDNINYKIQNDIVLQSPQPNFVKPNFQDEFTTDDFVSTSTSRINLNNNTSLDGIFELNNNIEYTNANFEIESVRDSLYNDATVKTSVLIDCSSLDDINLRCNNSTYNSDLNINPDKLKDNNEKVTKNSAASETTENFLIENHFLQAHKLNNNIITLITDCTDNIASQNGSYDHDITLKVRDKSNLETEEINFDVNNRNDYNIINTNKEITDKSYNTSTEHLNENDLINLKTRFFDKCNAIVNHSISNNTDIVDISRASEYVLKNDLTISKTLFSDQFRYVHNAIPSSVDIVDNSNRKNDVQNSREISEKDICVSSSKLQNNDQSNNDKINTNLERMKNNSIVTTLLNSNCNSINNYELTTYNNDTINSFDISNDSELSDKIFINYDKRHSSSRINMVQDKLVDKKFSLPTPPQSKISYDHGVKKPLSYYYPQFSCIFTASCRLQIITADKLVELMKFQCKLYEEWLEIMGDYSTVFSEQRGINSDSYNDDSAKMYNGNSCALHYRVKSSKPEVSNIITDVLSNDLATYQKNNHTNEQQWHELPSGLGLGLSWNLLWTWAKPAIDTNQLLIFQKINHFMDNKHLTHKDLLKKSISRFVDNNNPKVSEFFDIMPPTFILPYEYTNFVTSYLKYEQIKQSVTPWDCNNLFDDNSLNKFNEKIGNLWIVKPIGLSRGRGITLVQDIATLTYSSASVIQKYIEKPLLLAGYKFDLRLYVLVTSFQPLEAFLYQEGFARVSTELYSTTNDKLSNKFIHLTNSSIQKYNTEIENGNGLSEEDMNEGGSKINLLGESGLWNRLKILYPTINISNLWNDIINLIIKSLVMVNDKIPFQPNSFEIFGYDVIIEENYTPRLLEVNSSPSLARPHRLDSVVKNRLILDTLLLLNIPTFDRKKLYEILKKRLSDITKMKINYMNRSDQHLENDLISLLGNNFVPRQYGELPKHLGYYQMICPNTALYDTVLKYKAKIIKSSKLSG